jgi:hypothetical protein
MKVIVSLLMSIALMLSTTAMASATKKEIPAPAEKKVAAPAETKEVQPAAAAEVKPAEAAKPAEVKPETPAPAAAVEPAKEAAPAVPAAPVDPEKVIVTVNGTPIKEKNITADIDKRIASQAKKMESMGMPADEKTKAMMSDYFRDGVVDMQIERTLVADQLKAAKITVTPADADARFLQVVKNAGRTLDETKLDIEKQGMSIDDIKGEITGRLHRETLHIKPDNKLVAEADAKNSLMKIRSI